MGHARLADRVTVITGGASGIGKAAARLFASEGAKVVIADANSEKAGRVVQEVSEDEHSKIVFIETDVAEAAQVERLIDQTLSRFGRLDVLYGNAGVLYEGTAPETSIDIWRRTIDINLGGQFYLAKYGIPALIESGGGAIVLTASELGIVGTSRAVAYCASKGGVVNMARALAIDCAPYSIRVNCLAPGPVETPLLRDWLDGAENPHEMEESQKNSVLLKRFAAPDEIARTAMFLASDDSSFMTGSLVVVDGGATAWYGL